MEKDVLGYAIVRGSSSLLIYNDISKVWVKKPDENLFFNSLSEAKKSFNKIKTFKNTAGIMTVTRFEGHCLIFNKIRNDYE